MSIEGFTLPPGPPELCFDTNEFNRETFSVDDFLHKYRNAGSLEQMRDDLGLYLKILRTAMIELINEDYQDFVNLSAELVGLDKRIDTIQEPLVALRNQIMAVKETLDTTMSHVLKLLDDKKTIQNVEKKETDEAEISQSLTRIRSLLDDNELVDLQLLERLSLDFVQLEHRLQTHKIEDDRKIEANELERRLLESLRTIFLSSLQERNIKAIERSLKLYQLLNKSTSAEEVFKQDVVVPVMSKLISETSLQNNPQGLVGIYNRIIEFLKTKLVEILQAAKAVTGFDFLLNSFWSEIELRLELHLSSIFAPGNPEQFHQKFRSTLKFLDTIEQFYDDPVRFKEHKQYKSFLTKWNLPVYFQIRFQEIGATLETACSKPVNKEIIHEGEGFFKLEPFSVAISCITQSWSERVFLPQLFGRFFKLTLQFISRLTTWTEEAMEADLRDQSLTVSSLLMTLYVDIIAFDAKSPEILVLVLSNLPSGLLEQKSTVEQCFIESNAKLQSSLQTIETKIAQDMIANSLPYIKQVNDIPRLYRKTNREIPTKNCAYVDHTLTAAKDFYKQNASVLGPTKCNQFLQIVFSKLTTQYYAAVSEVLTSVQKTEESLRRLKNLRERSGAMVSSTSERQGISDDDKIRLQLQVDVIYWGKEIGEFGIDLNTIESLSQLRQLVEDATKIQTNE